MIYDYIKGLSLEELGAIGTAIFSLFINHKYFFALFDARKSRKLEWARKAKDSGLCSKEETACIERVEATILVGAATKIYADNPMRELLLSAIAGSNGRINLGNAARACGALKLHYRIDDDGQERVCIDHRILVSERIELYYNTVQMITVMLIALVAMVVAMFAIRGGKLKVFAIELLIFVALLGVTYGAARLWHGSRAVITVKNEIKRQVSGHVQVH